MNDNAAGYRATVESGLDADQADALEALVASVDGYLPTSPPSWPHSQPGDREAAWARWSDMDLLGGSLDGLIGRLADVEDPTGGAAWLRARHDAWFARTADAIALFETAHERGYRLAIVELAAIEADRSNAAAARSPARTGGRERRDRSRQRVRPTLRPAREFGAELAEEVAPFAAMRPTPMAGRNDRCPCGSGKKYKQCHLGNELHPLADRAGWLYVKMMRFMQVNNPHFPTVIADDMVDVVTDPDLRAMVHESYLSVDLALFEGGVAQWFLDAKRVPPASRRGRTARVVDQRHDEPSSRSSEHAPDRWT